MMFPYDGTWGFWQMALMWVGMVAFWGLLIWLVYLLVTRATGDRRGRDAEDPRRVLDSRLASGEIDVDEYTRLRDVLGTNAHSRVPHA